MSSASLNRFEWYKAVLQSDGLSATAKNIAGALAIQFANDKTDQLNPSQETLADYLKVHRDTVKRVLRELRNAGWLMSIGNGGRSKAPMMRLLSPSKIIPFKAVKGVTNHPPITEQRGDDLHLKGGGNAPPLYNDKQSLEQKAGSPNEPPSPQCSRIVHHGSEAEDTWNRWLAQFGYPSLSEIGLLTSDAKGRGWVMPFLLPPKQDDVIRFGIAEKRTWWLINRSNQRRSGAA